MKNSCGAIFYTFNPNNNIGVILGLEQGEWLPFKGCNENGESFMETAIREIKEETCGLVEISNISLDHKFTSKRKHYYIGICEVPFDIIEKFNIIRKNEKRKEYIEKEELKFFNLDTVLDCKEVHNISKASINYFMNKLILLNTSLQNKNLQNTNKIETKYNRKHSINIGYQNNLLSTINNFKLDKYNIEECNLDNYNLEDFSIQCNKKINFNDKYNQRKINSLTFNQRYYNVLNY
jgi:ADP-ribose pyrophosphatase YjhB (NUDIX family)